jgi:pimeloyl-ACP methyl ester carboxylesterase
VPWVELGGPIQCGRLLPGLTGPPPADQAQYPTWPYLGRMSAMRRAPKVSFSRLGPDSGPEVLLVHGIGVSRRYFAPLARELSSTHQVMTPDLPGFGDSSRPRPALTITEQAVALEAALQLEGRAGMILVGHSMGTQVVTELAARNPGLARGLILIGPVVEPPNRSALPQIWRLIRDLPREPFQVNALVLSDYVRGGVRSFAGSLPQMLHYPLADRLTAVTAPVLLVRGDRDPIASSSFLRTLAAAAAGDADIVQIPSAGHVAMAVRPDLVAQLCRRPWHLNKQS